MCHRSRSSRRRDQKHTGMFSTYRLICFGPNHGIVTDAYTDPGMYMAIAGYRTWLTSQQPYLDNDMQSRWWDFGGDTLVRADQYGMIHLCKFSADMCLTDTYDLHPIDHHAKDGSFHAFH